ncbi:GW dipeptide domain-containing protein [Sulfurimonas sp. C5]|uniref:GW dipeptide domain-containing protein n=1 Tax=Sulfurimonas sp. C5 TaxID=3036947 RepID=UPI002457179B|nr:GW dipeptide domain-containing protein [Sulfurimonas sp. C5]MDH4943784.1 GW dipeptide domain-containing protein [Sulfurimonas sp. C5]
MKKLALSLLLGISLYAASTHTATVLESMNSGGYTYMKVNDGKNSYWIAMTQRDVKKGSNISFTEQGWMKNFHSKTLNRTFDNILFAGDTVTQQEQEQVKYKPNIMTSKFQTKNTLTIAEVFKNREKYVGKTITVHAEVTKVSSGIMGKNWVHIEDGSRFMNMDDLVFTTVKETPKAGDIVFASGTLAKDKDFGYGYFYPVIIEQSNFKK